MPVCLLSIVVVSVLKIGYTIQEKGGAGFMGLIAVYFGKGYDGREIFDGLKIQQCEQFKKHLNQHNVIYMTFSEIPGECKELPAIYFPD